MKKMILLLSVLFFGAALLAGTALSVNKETLIVTTGEWAPWAGEKIKNKGFVCHILTEIFDRQGYNVEFRFYPWKRAETALIQGKAHASAFWYHSEERAKKVHYSDPFTEEKIVFFYRKDNPIKDWATLSDLKGYKIGVSRGNTYTDEFWDLNKKGVLNFDVANNDLTNIKKLARGRIDVFPGSLVMVTELMRKELKAEDLAKITYHEKPLSISTGHIIFPKVRDDSQKIMAAFNAGLKKIRADGRYDKYLNDMINGEYK